MEFDEYEYLEKMVENPELAGEKPSANGRGASAEEKDRGKSSKRRSSDDGERDSDRRSKRSRSAERSGRDYRERHREGGSSRHRDRGSPDRREKERHKERGRDREEREAERLREKERIREREKDKEKEREMEKEREREREKERSRRSTSRSERQRDEERERPRERSKERDYRERDRESRRHREKKEEGPEPEADPERDQRTVFAYQLSLKADERDVYEFFSRAGKVRDVRLIMDRNSRRSKGVGYIEFYDVMSVPMAIALSGQLLLGQPVMVKPSEAEKNLVQSNTAAGGTGLTGPNSGAARRLYVGNLHLNITEPQLRQVFEPFGQVELIQLPVDPLTGLCKGYGFIQFARLEDARAAQSLNGQLEIAGRTIKVSAVTDQAGVQDVGTNAGDLDDDEGGGLSLNASSRALLMQKLDRTGTASSVTGVLAAPAVNPPLLTAPSASVLGGPLASSILQPSVPALSGLPASGLPVALTTAPPLQTAGVPSECLLLKNMFDPSMETEPDFDLDIREDVQDECSKFGTVKHIFVDKNSGGYVFLRFDNVTSAMKAQNALHGRWFAGKMITATYMSLQQYEAKFPNAN